MSEKNSYHIHYDNYMSTNASTEVTGLIPSGAYSREEWDSYREIFNFDPVPMRGIDPGYDAGTEMTDEDL